jgi:hypothetical protein
MIIYRDKRKLSVSFVRFQVRRFRLPVLRPGQPASTLISQAAARAIFGVTRRAVQNIDDVRQVSVANQRSYNGPIR